MLYINFCAISFNRRQNQYFSKNSGKIAITESSSKPVLAKSISMSSFKVGIMHGKYCMIPCDKIQDRTIVKILVKSE